MSDFVKRLVVILIGLPIVVSLLKHNRIILLQSAHIMCSFEWIYLLSHEKAKVLSRIVSYEFLWFSTTSIFISFSTIPLFYISSFSLICYLIPCHYFTQDYHVHIILGYVYVSLGYFTLIQISEKSFDHSIMLMSIVWNCDTGALIVGRFLGVCDNNFMPFVTWLKQISPKKSCTGIGTYIIIHLLETQ